MKRLIFICILILNLGMLYAQDFNKLDEFFNVLDTHDKFMGTMNITKSGNEVFSKVIGFANLEEGVANKASTKFRIGSITKTFTAVIIFQMIEEGKLALVTPLAQYFPKMPNASKITIRHLLTHSSGLFNITNSEDFRTWMVQPATQEIMLSRMLKYQPDFEPGEKSAYSNTNFILLGYIAEAIDKQSYAQILKKRITSQIGLKDTYAGAAINVDNNECYSYSFESDHWQKAQETDMSNPAGAGVIVSTSNDITSFFTALFNKELISQESLEIMTTVKGDYGHGIFTQELNGMRMFGHNGGIDGFKSFAIYLPEQKLALAIVGNGVAYGLMPILINGIAASMGQDFEIPTFSKLELTETEAKQYEGEYTCDKVPFKLVFKANSKTVLMEVPEKGVIKELTPTKLNQFTLQALGIDLEFDLINNQLFLKEAGAEPLTFKKL